MVDVAGKTLGGLQAGLQTGMGLQQAEENRLRLQRQDERQARLDSMAQDRFQMQNAADEFATNLNFLYAGREEDAPRAIPFLRKNWVDMGRDPAAFDAQVAGADGRALKSMAGQLLGIKPTAAPAPDDVEYMYVGDETKDQKPGDRVTFDMKMPGDREKARSADWIVAPKVTGTPEETGVQIAGLNLKKEAPRWRQEMVNLTEKTQNVINEGNVVKGILAKNPDANTFISGMAGLATDFVQEAKAAAKIVGGDAESDANEYLEENYDQWDNQLREAGIANAKARSALIGMAYSAAKQIDGRVSDSDFKNFMKMAAASRSDPAAMTAVVDQFMEKAVSQYNSRYDAYKSVYKDVFDVERAVFDVGVEEGVAAAEETDWSPWEGQYLQNDGVTYKVVNGKLVKQ